MGVPQILWVVMTTYGVANVIYNPAATRVANAGHALVRIALLFALLVWGGFFDVMSWPQITWLALAVIAIHTNVAHHGMVVQRPNIVVYALCLTFAVFIFYSGGFFGA